jgi:hypothetical protein
MIGPMFPPRPRARALSAEHSREVNRLVLKEYRRTFHFYRKLTEWDAIYILEWTIDTAEGREAYADAVKLVTTPPKEVE